MKYRSFFGRFLILFLVFGCTFGKGKISVEIIYPEKTLVNPTLTVTAQTAGGSPEEITSETGERIEISSLEAGNYDVTITLKDGETVVWEKKISCLVDGAITTKIRYEITENDFTDFALYTPQIIVTELGENRYRVEIISSNYKGTIHYTMANPAEDPTASSTEYKAPFEINYDDEQGKVITARVFYKEFDPSEAAIFHLEKTATPQIEDTTVHRLSDKLTFAVTSADPDVIYYYTLDGTPPTTVMSSTEGLIELTQPGTITVKSFKESYLMSDSVVLPVERLPKPEVGEITENTDGATYSITFDYGSDAQAMFLTRDGTSVTAENCPMGNEQSLAAGTTYTVSDLLPTETLKTRSIAENFFASEEAVVESSQAETPVILDARSQTRNYADPLAVMFSTPETDATVYYTFDGNTPTDQSPSSASGTAVEVTDGTTVVKARAYAAGKFPSETAEQAVAKAVDPVSVSLSYWNLLVIEENASVPETEKNRGLFYRTADSDEFLIYEENTVYLDATAETTVSAVGGAEFCFPSDKVSSTFSLLNAPVPTDARSGSTAAAYLDPLTVDLTGGTAGSPSTEKYYVTRNGEEPTRQNAAEETNPKAVTVAAGETLKAVVSDLNKITSASASVDGTPLPKPKVEVADDGTVTIAAGDSEETPAPAASFYYKINDKTPFSSTAAGTLYNDTSKPHLSADETIYVVAAAEMHNPSETASVSLVPTDPPTFEDARDSLFYLPLSVRINGNNVLYGEGAGENSVQNPSTPYTDPIAPQSGNLWLGATAKDDDKTRSETATRQLFAFDAAPTVALSHSSPQFNIVTITPPATPVGLTGAVSLYYVLGGDFTSGQVQTYTAPVSIPQALLPAAADVPVKAVAGAEFARPSAEASQTFSRTEKPTVSDDRGTAFYKALQVAVAAGTTDNTASVYSSTDETTWTAAASPVTVAENALLYFMAAVDGKLTSESVEVDGAPLSAPEVDVDADGKLTVTAAAADAAVTGLEFWYLIDSDDFETGTPTKYEAASAPKLNDGQTCYVVAAAEMRNPSTPAVYNVETPPEEKPTAPIVTDSRTASGAPGSYFDPAASDSDSITLNITQAESVPVYYKYNNGNETQVSGNKVTVSKSQVGTYVFYAKTAGGTLSDEVTVEVKVLQEPKFEYDLSVPSATLVSPDGAVILYELGQTKTDVSSTSSVFTNFDNLMELPGKTLTAVAVDEFCFSSPQMKEEIPEDLPDPDEPVSPPTVTDTRTASGAPGEYFNPRNAGGSITLQITAAETAHKLFYKKDGGNETEVPPGGQLSLSQSDAGTYAFYAKSADGSKTSSEVTVEVKVLDKPVLSQNGDTASLSSPDGADILYEVADGSFTPVSESSSVYTSGVDLIGKYVSAVAVAEFCFSSEELQQQVPQPPADNVTVSFTDAGGDPVSNGTFREPQNILIVTEPANATVMYSIGSQSYDQTYTADTPILIDKNSDIYVKATADGKEATAVLKIRLKCPNPTPHLEVSSTDPSKYELTFEDFDTSEYQIYYTEDIDDSNGTLYSAPLLLSPDESIIVFAKKDGWESSDKILLSVPEILKRRGLTH